MPRKLSEIKQFVSKNSLNHILPDPAQNSVMGNIKKLHDALAEVPDDTIADGARKKLGTILDGFNGTYPETLRIFRSGFLPQTCLGSIRQHAGTVCIRSRTKRKRRN